MRERIESWWNSMSANQATTFMLQLGSVGTPFPTLIVQNSKQFTDLSDKPDLTTDRDMVVVRRFYTA